MNKLTHYCFNASFGLLLLFVKLKHYRDKNINQHTNINICIYLALSCNWKIAVFEIAISM